MMQNKKIKAFSAFILLLILLFSFAGCELASLGYDILGEKFYSVSGKKISLDKVMAEQEENSCYSKLNEIEKEIYCAALIATEQGENEFTANNVVNIKYVDSYANALYAFLDDYPEFFWYSGDVELLSEYIEGTGNGNVTMKLGLFEHWNDDNLPEAKEKFSQTLSALVEEASTLPSDYDKVKFVHDRIIHTAEYDYDSLDAGEAIDKESDAFVNTAYGAIVEGRAMCGAYARAFDAVMTELGIDTIFVTGIADEGPHAWNMIKLDGKYYHIDLTWNDCDGEPIDLRYDYFCLTTEDISMTHTIDQEYADIIADATDYNYFIREGLYLQSYSFAALNSVVKKVKPEKILSVRCADKVIFDSIIETMIDKSRFYDLEGMSGYDSVEYIVNENLLTITFIVG